MKTRLTQKQKDILCREVTARSLELQAQLRNKLPAEFRPMYVPVLGATCQELPDGPVPAYLKAAFTDLRPFLKAANRAWKRYLAERGRETNKATAKNRRACKRVDDVARDITLKVQFVDSYEEAKTVLDSFPSLKALGY